MSESITSKALLTGLNMIYLSLVFVMTFFGLFVFYLNYSGSNTVVPDESFEQLLKYVIFGLSPVGLAAGYFIYKQQLTAIAPNQTLRQKLSKFQTAILIRSACLEVPGLFGAVAAMITGNSFFLLFTLAVIIIFIILRPTPFSITSDLGLSQAEKNILENPSGKIE